MQEGRSRNMVGPQVRKLRRAAGLGQDDLAGRCSRLGFHISRSTVSHIETGVRGVSDLEMVMLARALRTPIDSLVPARLPRWTKDQRSPKLEPDKGHE
jgi:transcriptional regulator with XRE-family HTH domain